MEPTPAIEPTPTRAVLPHRFFELDRKFGLQDAGIAGALLVTLLYVVGYLARGFAAKYMNVGMLAIEPVYCIVAGIPAIAVLIFQFGCFYFVWRRLPYVRKFTSRYSFSSRMTLNVVLLGASLLQTYWFWGAPKGYASLLEFVTSVALTIVICGGLHVPEADEPNRPALRTAAVWLRRAFILWATFAALVQSTVWSAGLLLEVPQAMGGFHPELADLDIDINQLSEDTAWSLIVDFPRTGSTDEEIKEQDEYFEEVLKNPSNRIAVSSEVYILHVDEHAVWISKPFSPEFTYEQTLEIPRSAVRAIRWIQLPILEEIGVVPRREYVPVPEKRQPRRRPENSRQRPDGRKPPERST